MAEIPKVELVVIGAGWYGLSAAKTYLELNPSAEVVIFDTESTVGGVWCQDRLYPGLKSNNQHGTYEFSDFPMDDETYDVKPGQHIPGTVIHRYLTNYAERFDIFGKIQFRKKVESAEHMDEGGGWLLKVLDVEKPATDSFPIMTSKLIVATGLTSEPANLEIRGSDSFGAPLFHPKQFRQYATTLETTKRVCVLGGAKSAWDVVYQYASKGIEVDWVIRESGHGPFWMSPAHVTPMKKLLENLILTRVLTWLSPCIWGDADGYSGIRHLLHVTRIGRFLVDSFWKFLKSDILRLNNYSSHPETAKLQAWSDPFFVGAGFSILNYDNDFFQLVRDGLVRVHIADIDYLSEKKVHLSDGQVLLTDALITCTGWKHMPPLTFSPSELDLGLPRKQSHSDSISLIDKADAEIFTRFPRLLDQPSPNSKAKQNSEEDCTSYNLYRLMIPPSTTEYRDIAFAGSLMPISNACTAQAQALWISAYFNHQISLPDAQDLQYETVLHNRFSKWRYSAGHGSSFPDFVFCTIPYIDLLLKDLGLNRWRKRSSFKEIFEAYGPMDYEGLVEEWKNQEQKRRGGVGMLIEHDEKSKQLA